MPPLISLIPTRFCLLLTCLCIGNHAFAQNLLEPLIVTGKAENLIGKAESASEGQSDHDELLERPFLRRGELLEVVPGMIVTQHAGGGKANQYFVRGYNLDHGTDFGIFVDGMPANYRAHGHGQGYTDLNFLIPEFVGSLDYRKGPFAPSMGDLTTAGSAEFSLAPSLSQNFLSLTAGENDYYRAAAGTSWKVGNGTLTLGGEATYYDGPWLLEEDSHRYNGLIRWHTGTEDDFLSLTLLAYQSQWTSSDQIPERAVYSGLIPLLGYLDPTNGGQSQRYSLSANWGSRQGNVRWHGNAYLGYYDLDLYSNFTYFLEDPVNGDQFRQSDQRVFFGGELSATLENHQLFGHETNTTLGFQTRNDIIWDLGLARTRARHDVKPIREDDVFTGNYSLFLASKTRWLPWLRTETGARIDTFHFDVQSDRSINSGNAWEAIATPKLNFIFGPWQQTEAYLNLGGGFHSNDARGLFTRIDPNDGVTPVAPVDPLVRTWGAEVGVRHQWGSSLTSTAAFWYLYSESELLYVGDAGNVEAGPSTDRCGIELSTYWRPTEWFSADMEIALSQGRYTDTSSGPWVENQVPIVISSGLHLGHPTGPYSTLRARYFSERPLVADRSVESEDSFQVNLRTGYRFKNWDIALEVLNLFDRADRDIEYYYTSRIPGEAAAGINDIHFHPAEPRSIRLSATYFW